MECECDFEDEYSRSSVGVIKKGSENADVSTQGQATNFHVQAIPAWVDDLKCQQATD